VISNIDLAVFTFDQENRLRLVNDAGIRLLNRQSKEILGSTAAELGLEECLQGNRTGVLQRSFPGSFGTRWEIRRSAFRQEGRPHQLLVLSDLSQTLREEERRAWQRLIRVMGHELNNSLAPIQSVAQSLESGLNSLRNEGDLQPGTNRALLDDIQQGFGIIRLRTEALGRFMAAYSRLARLPAPKLAPVSVRDWVSRVAKLETRVKVKIQEGPEATISGDADQLEQLLINLLHNAVDAVLECGTQASVSTLLITVGLA